MRKNYVLAIFLLPFSAFSSVVYQKDGDILDLYGSIRGRHIISDNKSVDGDGSYIRFGLKGQTRINDSLTGYGQWEYQAQFNNSEGSDAQKGNKTRLGFAGLKLAKFGSVDYGRNWGVAYDVASITDKAPFFDELSYVSPDNFMTSRANGLLTWRNTDFFDLVDGLALTLQYQGKNHASSDSGRAATASNGDGYGMSISYDLTHDVSVKGAYTSSKRTSAQNQLTYGDGERAELWTAGIKYDDSRLYFGALYSGGHNVVKISSSGYANTSQSFEAVASYLFSTGIKPLVGYFYSEGKDIEGGGKTKLLNYVDFTLTYYLNKNMSAYVDYKYNLLSAGNPVAIDTTNKLGLGLTYQF